MKWIDIFHISIKNTFRRKKNIFPILIFTVISLIIIGCCSFYKTIDYVIEKGVKNSIDYRTLDLFYDYEIMTDEEAVERVKEIDHIVDVYTDMERFTGISFSSLGNLLESSGYFLLHGADTRLFENFTFVDGHVFSNDSMNEIICPVNFYPVGNLDDSIGILKREDFLNMRNLLGEAIDFEYSAIYGEKFGEKKYQDSLTVVGVFLNDPFNLDENICYASHATIRKIVTRERQYMEPGISTALLHVDHTENIEYVQAELKKMGFESTRWVTIYPFFTDFLPILVIFVLIFCFCFSFFLSHFYDKKVLQDKVYEVSIYTSIGYEQKDIKRILFIESLIVVLISIFLSTIMIFGMYGILQLLLYYKPLMFLKITIVIDFMSIFYAFVFFLIIILVDLYWFSKELLK